MRASRQDHATGWQIGAVKPAILAALVLTGCMSAAQPAEPVALTASTPPGPWSVMRDALVSCATDHGLSGDLVTRVVLGEDGIVLNVHSAYGNSFASCVGSSLMRTRFRAQRGRSYDVSYQVRPPGVPDATAVSPAEPQCPEECNN